MYGSIWKYVLTKEQTQCHLFPLTIDTTVTTSINNKNIESELFSIRVSSSLSPSLHGVCVCVREVSFFYYYLVSSVVRPVEPNRDTYIMIWRMKWHLWIHNRTMWNAFFILCHANFPFWPKRFACLSFIVVAVIRLLLFLLFCSMHFIVVRWRDECMPYYTQYVSVRISACRCVCEVFF